MKAINNCVCPVAIAGALDNIVRKWLQDPQKILQPYIKEGMTVLDLGCSSGFFARTMAEMVGDHGKVIAADLQAGMLRKLKKRTPSIKSIWSNGIQSLPRSIPALLLKKLSMISPSKAPKHIEPTIGIIRGKRPKSLSPKKENSLLFAYIATIEKPKPQVIPMNAPLIRPRQVFPSPNIRLPSFHFLPKSIGVPPPIRRALALAM